MNHSACYFSFSVWGLTIYFVALKDNLCSHRTLASYFLLYWAHYSFLFKYLQSQPPLMFLLKYLLNIFSYFVYIILFCIKIGKENHSCLAPLCNMSSLFKSSQMKLQNNSRNLKYELSSWFSIKPVGLNPITRSEFWNIDWTKKDKV